MKTASLASVLLSASFLAACGAEVEGSWQSRDLLSNEERNRITFLPEGSGDMKLFASPAGSPEGQPLAKIKFDFDWEGDGESFDVDAKCKEGCLEGVALDFSMECTLDGEFDHLDCDAKAPFEKYGFLEFEPMADSE